MKRFFAKVFPSVIAVVFSLLSCEQTSLEKESAEDSLLSVFGLFGNASGATISVTIDQDPIQPDPVNTVPVTFIVVFSNPIDPATFDEFDINQTGTATGITWAAPTTSDNISWTLEATAVTGGGTIVPAIAAGAAQDLVGDFTFASTSTDNSVTYDAGSPAVTVNQEATQADPTASSPVLFTVVFSEAINPATFSTADITQGGTASGITWTLTASGGNTWDLSAVLSTSGTVIPSIAASQVQDLAGNPNTASSSTDNSVMYTIVPSAQIVQTGQALCYDENGVVVSCGGTGQDADLLKGLAWAAPRFTDNGDGTITDNSTGLIWTADMNLMNGAYSFLDTDATAGDGIVYWQTALDFAAQLNTDTYGSRTDWRIPNILELMSLMNYGTNDVPAWLASFGFSNTGFFYWSSTTYRVISTGTIAWTFSYTTGTKGNSADKASAAFVNALAVAGSSTILPQTGQTECWDPAGTLLGSCSGTGQDGEYQEGLPLPGTRFTHNGDGTTTDNLTGLMWTTNKNLMLTAYPGLDTDETAGDGAVYWENALAFIDQLNTDGYAGYSDWRLPNVNEMLSVFQHDLVYADLTSLGFVNGTVQTCWTSTTTETNTPDAYLYNILYGNQGAWLKTGLPNSDRNVWPVRGN